jgi:penicillin-binding protein 1A
MPDKPPASKTRVTRASATVSHPTSRTRNAKEPLRNRNAPRDEKPVKPNSKPNSKPSSKPSSKKDKPKRRGFFRRHAKGIAFIVLAPPLAIIAAIFWYARGVSLPADLVSNQTTLIFTDKNEQLAAFKSDTDRTNVTFADIPPVMRDAVLASEDKSFYSHNGVDPLGIVRAVYRDVRNQGAKQGGSTLTQQYVKISYTGRERSYKRKLREAILAVKLERKLTKDEIFERYLNSVYFGRGATGVQAAARAYFEKDAKDLSLPESAYLAGVLRAPENTDARRNPERAKFRRDSVLTNMAKLGFITEAQRATAEAIPLTGVGGIVRAKPTSTINFSEAGTEYAVDMVRRELVTRFGAAKVFGGGLRVTTTINIATQRRARAALFDEVLNRPGDPDGAMVVLNHEGRVIALVGGRSWAQLQVNLAEGRGFGGLGRQAGSTFKPFVLAAAVREGISVETKFPAPKEVSIPGANVDGTEWIVSNFDDVGYANDIDLRTATASSVNTVYAQLITDQRVGAERVVAMAKDLGITAPLQPYPAIALGTEEVSPLEMADAYLTFAREGTRVAPTLITKVTNNTGEVLFEAKTDPTRVLSTDEAAIINQTLRGVVDAGSGVKAQLTDGRQVAGKTGTTQNARDAWFVGYTPKNCCVVAIWMGYPTTNQAMTKVHGKRVTGGAFPADIFGKFMNKQVANIDTGEFDVPDEASTGEVIKPKLSSNPVKKKKKKPSVLTTDAIGGTSDTTPPDTTPADNPVQVVTDTEPPRTVDPVSAGSSSSDTKPVDSPSEPKPKTTKAPKPEPQTPQSPQSPVKPADPPPAKDPDTGPVQVAPPVVKVEAPPPTVAPSS